jgi:uncharacterized membrane protein YsdA (DUF1294 family)
MVPAAQGQALLIGEGGKIVRMHPFHHETEQRPTQIKNILAEVRDRGHTHLDAGK